MKTPTKEFTTIDQYITQYPAEIQSRMEELRKVIQEEAPEATEAIKYAMPAFVFHGNLAYFAAYKNHIGFYPFPSGVEEFMKLSDGFATSKGGIQFPHDKPIPFDLVRKVIKYRMEENIKREKAKKGSY